MTRLPFPAPTRPKHDRVVLMAQADSSLRYEDDGGVVALEDVIRRHCERKDRERRDGARLLCAIATFN